MTTTAYMSGDWCLWSGGGMFDGGFWSGTEEDGSVISSRHSSLGLRAGRHVSCNCSAHVRKPHIDTVSFNVLHCFQSNFGTITTKFCYKSWLYQTSMDTGSFHGWNIAFLSFICTLQTLGLSPHNLYELVPNQEGLHLFHNPLRSHRESINL